MDELQKDISFKDKSDYELGSVTYKVTAHFDPGQESLKSKVSTLLGGALRKLSSDNIAVNHNHAVE